MLSKLFGIGLVSTPDDFGTSGESPSHPELLDWLAGEFVRGGWSLKKLHRTIMLSSAYQMDSRWHSMSAEEADPANRLLWRANRRRLEAEALWDTIHVVSGTLNPKMGGRPVVPRLDADDGPPPVWVVSADPSERTRRGIYVLQRRNFRFPMFDIFDLPVNAVSAPARDVSTVAPQALWLLNNATVRTQAAAFASRIIKLAGEKAGLTVLIENAWRIALVRPPSEHEKTEAAALLHTLSPEKPHEALPQLCLALFNLQEFAYAD